MASPASTNPVLTQIKYAEDLGLLDDQTSYCYSLKQYEDDPYYFLNLLVTFLNNAPLCIANIEATLKQNVIDFTDLVRDSVKLRGCSGSAGAFLLRNACGDLRMAADKCNKDGCVQAFIVVKREFAAVKPHVDAIVQLEREDIGKGNY